MIPANVREAMERMKGDEWTGSDAVVVATYAVPILDRLGAAVDRCEKIIYSLGTEPKGRAAEWLEFFAIKLDAMQSVLGDT